ncbi:MAG TPA: DRTGG domain-containing protein [Burkholderiales bacterium]|nr:DRTGG domain-containing protein [Burkholderiales bacterium]
MITLRDVLTRLNGELLTPGIPLELECPKVFASDLMSDVLTSAEPGSFLLTGLVNQHVIRTCCLADLAAVVFVQGKRPDAGVMEQARAEHLPLIATKLPMFEACSRLSALFGGKGLGR